MGAANIIVRLRDLLEAGRQDDALALARRQLDPAPTTSLSLAFDIAADRATMGSPVVPVPSLTPPQRLAICHRDGFVDRLSPQRWRLVYPGAIYVLARELPGAIDTHPTGPWAYKHNAPVWWDLWPTVDHLTPRARGGTNTGDNLACVSWWRNAAKGDYTLPETGWTLQRPGSPDEWDGLLEWFIDRVRRRPHLAHDRAIRDYITAASAIISTDGIDLASAPIDTPARRASAPPSSPTTSVRRCRKPVWETNSRGAYHSHRLPTEPTAWMAASGTWRVIQHEGRRRTLELLLDGVWHTYEAGTSSDRLLALAAHIDHHDGVPAANPDQQCWLNAC